MDKNKMNIESYDGADAYYEGSDKEYEDFLKQVDGNTHTAEEAAPVADTFTDDVTDAGETINIKGVIDMVRKKAGEFGSAAKKIGDGVKDQINDYRAMANERAEEKKAEIFDAASELKEDITDKAMEFADDVNIPSTISNTAKAAKHHIKSAQNAAKEKLSSVSSIGSDVDNISKSVLAIIGKLDEASAKINELEAKQIENRNNYDRGINDLRVSITNMSNDLADVKQNSNNIAKLNDSVFDLRNAQQNMKKSLGELEARIISLRKKCVMGITVVSVLSAIMIILEIINLFS